LRPDIFFQTASARCAFFDVDGTLIRIKSMFSFSAFLFEQLNMHDEPGVVVYRQQMQAMLESGATREELNRFYYTIFAGLQVDLVARYGRQWYVTHCQHDVFFSEMLDVLRQHKKLGHRTVVVSGSFNAVLQPLADAIGIDDLICAPLEIREDGCYSGHLVGLPTIGEGKACGIRAYARKHDITLTNCFAYGDDISDLPMLGEVGTAITVNPDKALLAITQERGWRFIQAT
jgi:HAD superfamily hydrolase (TIGR01490 family)